MIMLRSALAGSLTTVITKTSRSRNVGESAKPLDRALDVGIIERNGGLDVVIAQERQHKQEGENEHGRRDACWAAGEPADSGRRTGDRQIEDEQADQAECDSQRQSGVATVAAHGP